MLLLHSKVSIANPGDSYRCSVDSMITADSSDQSFLSSNLKKVFLITETKDNLYISFSSPNGISGQEIYTIIQQAPNEVIAVGIDSIGLRTVVLEQTYKQGVKAVQGRSHYNATISLQGNFFANTWVLHCKK